MEFLALALPGVFFGGFAVFLVMSNRARNRAFRAALHKDMDVEVVEKAFVVGCRTKRAPFVEVIPTGGGKNNPTRWDASALAPRLGARTSLHVSQEGIAGSLRELLGFKDIHTGDAELDRALTLRGSEADVVRGIFKSSDVRTAALAIVSVAWTFDIRGERGVVAARFGRRGLDATQAKNTALAVQRFVEVLEQHANDPPAAPPASTTTSGGASGAPVGVPR